jgi:hypothetical protein
VHSGIRLDSSAHFWHDGARIEHPAIQRAWHRGLERAEDGRYLIRFGNDWAYIAVEDAPFLVRRILAREGDDGFFLRLSDGSEERLDPRTLTRSKDEVLYCLVKGDHRARLSRLAQLDLMNHLQEEGPGRYSLFDGKHAWPIEADAGTPPPLPWEGAAPTDDPSPAGASR